MLRRRVSGKYVKGQCAQTAAGTVADNGITDFGGSCEAITEIGISLKWPHLKYKAKCNPFLSGFCHLKKFRSAAKNG